MLFGLIETKLLKCFSNQGAQILLSPCFQSITVFLAHSLGPALLFTVLCLRWAFLAFRFQPEATSGKRQFLTFQSCLHIFLSEHSCGVECYIYLCGWWACLSERNWRQFRFRKNKNRPERLQEGGRRTSDLNMLSLVYQQDLLAWSVRDLIVS